MKTTIDRAGRVIIPAPLRRRLGLLPGTELEVVVDDLSVRLLRRVPRPRLVREGRLLVARPTVSRRKRPEIDIHRLIEEERNRWLG